jgi:formamidopyrimidine-DNA glycosylase
MSIEAPEAYVLSMQMNSSLVGKVVRDVELHDVEKMQRIGFINEDLQSYQNLVGEAVESVSARGNTILVKLSNRVNIVIGPEYGGVLRLFNPEEVAEKYHLRVGFVDGYNLTIRLISMGIITVVSDDELLSNYLYKRDFLGKHSPLENEFTSEVLSTAIISQSRNLKSLLVGKNALMVGLSNSGFQDVLYKARIDPRRRGSDLSKEEANRLYESIVNTIKNRIILGGKSGFSDFYGAEGRYEAAMGPNMKNRECPMCGAKIESIKLGGGQVYLCQNCQT